MLYVTPLNTTTVYLLRHAEAVGAGLSDGLTEQGQADAQALVASLEPLEIDAVCASPAVRARETVAPFAAAKDLSITTIPDLRDHRLSLQTASPDDPMLETRFTNRSAARPGGESFNAASGRMRQAILSISRRPYAAPLLCTHSGLIASLLSQLNRNYGFAEFQQMPRPALYKITHRRGSPISVEPVRLT